MEDSEKRRQRLKAMRTEAAHAEDSNNLEASAMPGCLSNPLIETSAAMAVHESCGPRFDFYTDPMSAFSDSKKRSVAGSQIPPDYFTPPSNSASPMAQFSPSFPGPRNPVRTPYPTHQFQSSFSPNQRIYQAHSSGPHRSPIRMASPFPMHPRPPEVWNESISTSYNSPSNQSRGSNFPGPGPGMHPRPPDVWNGSISTSYNSPSNQSRGSNFPGPGPGMHPRPPDVWNGSISTSYNSPSNQSRGSNFPGPGFGPTGSPSFNTGQGRARWVSHSPSPGSGRGSHSPSSGRGSHSPSSGRGGRGWYGSSMSPGLGSSGGRGRGSRSRFPAQDTVPGPEMYYSKSMLDDPWKSLEPVTWKGGYAPVNSLNTPDSSKSLSNKKTRVSEASNKSSSQPSLAEYLAASFNEAVNDTPST